jgi:isoleucyl-tRNA synthetase
MSPAPELKATLTLPQTAFPMKANLPQNEPLRLARWASLGLYDEAAQGRNWPPAYLLHDGPPYANGPIHLGHALNKGLKDFVVKSKTMAGFDAPYVPGYDCHGLPIEIKVDEQLGSKKLEMPVPAVLDACRAYAQKYIDLQTSQFERIGCFGRWDKPYKTMSRDYEARTLEAFYGFLEKASSIAASSRSTGAFTTAPRWPRPRWSTRCTPAPRSTCATGSLRTPVGD